MFIWTAKVSRRKLAAAVVMAGLVCGLAVTAVVGTRPAAAAMAVSPKGVRSEEDRVAYLQGWGWQISPQATLVEELELPKEFGEEYSEYLALQQEQGFDLTKYAGKRVKRYTYEVLNYPTGEAGVTAHLLLYRNRVIGGEIAGEDFLHSLAKPE